jgi:hypothetical protein
VQPPRHRERRPALAAAALVSTLGALAGLAACTGGGSGGTASGSPAATGEAHAVSAAPPGKYQSLPEPCGAVQQSTLHGLVPGAADYAGTPKLTYDTDRIAGCSWHGTGDEKSTDPGAAAAGELRVTLERLVSYDPSVSDDSVAAQEYASRARTAHITLPATTSPSPSGGSGSASPAGPGTASGAPSATASGAPDPGDTLAPRALADLGNEAYVDDHLGTGAVPHRTITVVVRKSNVLVTVVYERWPATADADSDSALQQDARKVAGEVAADLDE